MNIVKRIFLFLITNILIVTTISLVTNALGLHGYLTEHGIDYQALAAICLIWGMTGSLISLWISRWMAKMAMGVKLIDPLTNVQKERQLIQVVHRLGRRIGLSKMPQVGIYNSQDINAFATGATRNRSLVAVSSGLLNKMSEDEVEGVLAHEMSHIANGDMVTMTLLQGVVNAFTLFLSRAFAYVLSESMHNNRERRNRSLLLYSVLVFLFDVFLTLLGSLVVAAFSRHREYRADRGGARLAGREKMIAALERLRTVIMPMEEQDVVASLKINTRRPRFLSLLASHPDINLRIAALKNHR